MNSKRLVMHRGWQLTAISATYPKNFDHYWSNYYIQGATGYYEQEAFDDNEAGFPVGFIDGD